MPNLTAKSIEYRHSCAPARIIMTILIVACILCHAGCEDLPSVSPTAEAKTISADAVSNSGRGGYDWPKALDGFEVQPPTDIKFIKRIDRDLIKTNLVDLDPNPKTEISQIAGLDPDVREWLTQITGPPASGAAMLTIDFPDMTKGKFDISDDAKYLVAMGPELRIWELESGNRIISHKLPFPSVAMVRWDRSNKTILVVAADGVHRIAMESGEVINSWKSPESAPVNLVCARDADVYAVCCENNELYLLDESLSVKAKLRGMKLSGTEMAIYDNGSHVFCMILGRQTLWDCETEDTEPISRPAEPPSEEPLLMGTCPTVGYIRGDIFVKFPTSSSPGVEEFQINAKCIDMISGDDGKLDRWFTVLGHRKNSEQEDEYFACDMRLPTFTHSDPFLVGNKPVFEIRGDSSTDIIAVRDSQEIRVYKRPHWR